MLKQKVDYMAPIEEAKRQDEVDQISDFGSEEADQNERNLRVVSTKEEAREFCMEKVETGVIADMLRSYVGKIVRVQQFLLTLVLRKRFLRKQRAILKI